MGVELGADDFTFFVCSLSDDVYDCFPTGHYSARVLSHEYVETFNERILLEQLHEVLLKVELRQFKENIVRYVCHVLIR